MIKILSWIFLNIQYNSSQNYTLKLTYSFYFNLNLKNILPTKTYMRGVEGGVKKGCPEGHSPPHAGGPGGAVLPLGKPNP
jgi:hypothetical protein